MTEKIDAIDEITVAKADVLKVLEENRAAHVAEYEKAYAGYRKAFVVEAEQILRDAKEGKAFQHNIKIPVPSSYAKDYDRVIGMLKMSMASHISLSSMEYMQYIQDEWNWKTGFSSTVMNYTGPGPVARK